MTKRYPVFSLLGACHDFHVTMYLFIFLIVSCLTLAKFFLAVLLNPFSTNVPIMDKPGSWFLLAKCLKNTCGRVTF